MVRTSWVVIALLSVTGTLSAQKSREPLPPQVPVSFTPPAGLCRVWLDGVPASQQPAPTDCASAMKNRPANAAVVFGPNAPKRGDADESDSFNRFRGAVPAGRFMAPGFTSRREKVRADDKKGEDKKGDEKRPDDRDRADSTKATRKPEKPF